MGSIAVGLGVHHTNLEAFNVDSGTIESAEQVEEGDCLVLPLSRVTPLSSAEAEALKGYSWRDGCLDSPDQLSTVHVPYMNLEGEAKMGRLVMNAQIAREAGDIFEDIYSTGFEINTIEPLEDIIPEHMKTDDPAEGEKLDNYSMEQNNTSGFNCRYVVGGEEKKLSTHAVGKAVDINPVQNPYVYGDNFVAPEEGKNYLDRTQDTKGLITPDNEIGEEVIKAFTSRGWRWGGNFNSSLDYQHFHKP